MLSSRGYGILAVAATLPAAAAHLLLPWLTLHGPADASRVVDWRTMTAQSSFLYEREILWLPIGGAAVAFVAGLMLLAWPTPSRRSAVARGAVALGGFALLLSGMRFVGFAFARVLEPAPSQTLLHAPPWLQLGSGALLLGGFWATRDPLSPPSPAGAVATVAAALLVALAAAPLAAQHPSGFHYDELTLDWIRALGAPGTESAVALLALRGVLAGLLLTACGASLVPALRRLLRPATAAAGLAALACAVLFYVRLPALYAGAGPWPNPMLALAGPALLLLSARASTASKGTRESTSKGKRKPRFHRKLGSKR